MKEKGKEEKEPSPSHSPDVQGRLEEEEHHTQQQQRGVQRPPTTSLPEEVQGRESPTKSPRAKIHGTSSVLPISSHRRAKNKDEASLSHSPDSQQSRLEARHSQPADMGFPQEIEPRHSVEDDAEASTPRDARGKTAIVMEDGEDHGSKKKKKKSKTKKKKNVGEATDHHSSTPLGGRSEESPPKVSAVEKKLQEADKEKNKIDIFSTLSTRSTESPPRKKEKSRTKGKEKEKEVQKIKEEAEKKMAWAGAAAGLINKIFTSQATAVADAAKGQHSGEVSEEPLPAERRHRRLYAISRLAIMHRRLFACFIDSYLKSRFQYYNMESRLLLLNVECLKVNHQHLH